MRPYYVAMVGAGPAGYYAAGALLAFGDMCAAQGGGDVCIDMLEMLPTPWGLVRSGVAPDHPKIKSVSSVFEKIAQDRRFRFFGNITVGHDIAPDELANYYDAVIYAVGAQSERTLGIVGEELPGSIAAADLVGWYNAHPHFAHVDPDISGDRAVVVGNGNVALDIARILVKNPDVLATTDIADHALVSLSERGIREVVIVGRRGPLQSAFSTIELREIGELEGVDVVVDPAELADITDEECRAAGKFAVSTMNVLRSYAQRSYEQRSYEQGHGEHDGVCTRRRIVLKFCLSPREIHGTDRVESLILGRNRLVRDDTGRVIAEDTGERLTMAAQLVVRAVGYRGVAISGLPFDDVAGVIPHNNGRIVGRRNDYVVGWIKRGPSGVIGSNKKDAQATVDTVIADLIHTDLNDVGLDYSDRLSRWLLEHQPGLVTQVHWQRIDTYERDCGQQYGRPRIKIAQLSDLLGIAHDR